jgi:hypothetical protein
MLQETSIVLAKEFRHTIVNIKVSRIEASSNPKDMLNL